MDTENDGEARRNTNAADTTRVVSTRDSENGCNPAPPQKAGDKCDDFFVTILLVLFACYGMILWCMLSLRGKRWESLSRTPRTGNYSSAPKSAPSHNRRNTENPKGCRNGDEMALQNKETEPKSNANNPEDPATRCSDTKRARETTVSSTSSSARATSTRSTDETVDSSSSHRPQNPILVSELSDPSDLHRSNIGAEYNALRVFPPKEATRNTTVNNASNPLRSSSPAPRAPENSNPSSTDGTITDSYDPKHHPLQRDNGVVRAYPPTEANHKTTTQKTGILRRYPAANPTTQTSNAIPDCETGNANDPIRSHENGEESLAATLRRSIPTTKNPIHTTASSKAMAHSEDKKFISEEKEEISQPFGAVLDPSEASHETIPEISSVALRTPNRPIGNRNVVTDSLIEDDEKILDGSPKTQEKGQASNNSIRKGTEIGDSIHHAHEFLPPPKNRNVALSPIHETMPCDQSVRDTTERNSAAPPISSTHHAAPNYPTGLQSMSRDSGEVSETDNSCTIDTYKPKRKTRKLHAPTLDAIEEWVRSGVVASETFVEEDMVNLAARIHRFTVDRMRGKIKGSVAATVNHRKHDMGATTTNPEYEHLYEAVYQREEFLTIASEVSRRLGESYRGIVYSHQPNAKPKPATFKWVKTAAGLDRDSGIHQDFFDDLCCDDDDEEKQGGETSAMLTANGDIVTVSRRSKRVRSMATKKKVGKKELRNFRILSDVAKELLQELDAPPKNTTKGAKRKATSTETKRTRKERKVDSNTREVLVPRAMNGDSIPRTLLEPQEAGIAAKGSDVITRMQPFRGPQHIGKKPLASQRDNPNSMGRENIVTTNQPSGPLQAIQVTEHNAKFASPGSEITCDTDPRSATNGSARHTPVPIADPHDSDDTDGKILAVQSIVESAFRAHDDEIASEERNMVPPRFSGAKGPPVPEDLVHPIEDEDTGYVRKKVSFVHNRLGLHIKANGKRVVVVNVVNPEYKDKIQSGDLLMEIGPHRVDKLLNHQIADIMRIVSRPTVLTFLTPLTPSAVTTTAPRADSKTRDPGAKRLLTSC